MIGGSFFALDRFVFLAGFAATLMGVVDSEADDACTFAIVAMSVGGIVDGCE